MKFILKRSLINSKYYVIPDVADVKPQDLVWFRTFGEPTLNIRLDGGGSKVPIKLTFLSQYSSFGFSLQSEADQYAAELKEEISEIKARMESTRDQWSGSEEI